MTKITGDAAELTDDQIRRVADVPPVKDLEAAKPSAAPIDLEHEALEQAVGKTLPRDRPRRSAHPPG